MNPEQLTIVGLLFAIGAAGVAKQWVFGWVYAAKVTDLGDMIEDRNFWRDTALAALGHTDKALAVAAKKKVNG